MKGVKGFASIVPSSFDRDLASRSRFYAPRTLHGLHLACQGSSAGHGRRSLE